MQFAIDLEHTVSELTFNTTLDQSTNQNNIEGETRAFQKAFCPIFSPSLEPSIVFAHCGRQSIAMMTNLSLRIIRKRRSQRLAVVRMGLLFVLLSNMILTININLFSTVTVEAFAAPKQQRNEAPSYSSAGRQKKRASKTGGNKNWYDKRKAGIKVQSRGPKPPKWEKEGDDLYVNHNSNSKDA